MCQPGGVVRPISAVGTPRLLLVPLTVDAAAEMHAVLAHPETYVFTGGEPPSVVELHQRYTVQVSGGPPDGSAVWLNWVVRLRATGTAIGYVQATVRGVDAEPVAELAWVIGTAHQGRGFATEAAQAMVGWLREEGVGTVTALIHPAHAASAVVARRCGLAVTEEVVDGEVRWAGREDGVPVVRAPTGGPPITPAMVARALDED